MENFATTAACLLTEEPKEPAGTILIYTLTKMANWTVLMSFIIKITLKKSDIGKMVNNTACSKCTQKMVFLLTVVLLKMEKETDLQNNFITIQEN